MVEETGRESTVLSRTIKIFVSAVAVAIIIFYGLFYVQEAVKFANFSKSGVVLSSITGADSNLVFARVDTADYAGGPYPSEGDRLLVINDSSATTAILNEHFRSPHPPGYEVVITYLSKDDTLQTKVHTRPRERRQIIIQAILMILRFLISVCYLGVGVWAFAKRPDSGAVRSLTLFCLAMGGFIMTTVTMIDNNYSPLSLPLMELLNKGISIMALFFGAFWLNLQFLFPAPRDFVKRHPLATYVLCYLPTAIVYLILEITRNNILGLILVGLIIAQVTAGFHLLNSYHRKTKELIEKRQTRLVIWGTGVGLIGLGFFIVIFITASDWIAHLPENYVIGALMVVFSGLLLSPFSFAYAFGKYRLLEIEGRIRRGTRHFLISLALLALFYLLIYFSSEFILNILGVESRTPVLIIALVLATGFTPAQRRLLGLLDKWIYPERFRLKEMLDDFLRQSLATTDKKVFWKELEDRLKIALKVAQVYPVLRAVNNGHFEHWSGALTPFDKESNFIDAISKVGGRPVMRDELEAGGKISFTDGETEWFRTHQVALVLPLITRTELIGFLGIGLKSEKGDFEPADFEILRSLANQIAVTTDNMILLEENAEKRRMETELSIARKVQKGMLPHDLPDTPGLEVATRCKFCTEVAGDYYDVIDVGQGKTVLAIGDVSGKGAGAALLMSNVQASLRTAVGMGSAVSAGDGEMSSNIPDIRLAEMVANINRLIYRNSQPEQFITFFVALFDAESGRLDYVNAGHNRPLAVTGAGEIKELGEGGILLGAVPEMSYQQGSIKLNAGDIAFLYTDGLSEAFNINDEMFGEARIKRFLSANVGLTPQVFLKKLEEEVESFIGSRNLTDDFTLLAARVK